MKILMTHRFFYPDTAPYGIMLRSIAEALAESGHDVSVFSSLPSYRKGQNAPYRENLGRLKVRRQWVFGDEKASLLKRVANVVLYSVGLFLQILRVRPDVVSASTFPPVLAAWSASLAAKLTGASFVYHLQDIHPEVSIAFGGMLGRRLPARILRWIDNQSLQRADAIVTLSEDMKKTLCARGLGPLPIHVINNFALEDFSPGVGKPPQELRKAHGRRRVIFAGNLGHFQDLPLLTEGIELSLAHHPDLELMFLGEGTAAEELKRRWGEHSQVIFGPFLPYAQACELIKEGDVGLISLREEIYRVAYPSKLLTYLALGLPVLALIEQESALARLLQEAGLGAVPLARTPEEIAKALDRLLANPISSAHIQRWCSNNADKDAVLAQWSSLFHKLDKKLSLAAMT